jgi:type III pantothenate kinase
LDLLIDIGNSRVKWASLREGRLGPQSAADGRAWGEADWRREIERVRPKRVIAASVGAPPAREALIAATRQVTGREPQFVTSMAQAAGVRNGYSNPAQLGVDRWLAVIGAFHRHHAACCVIDAGTALTIDGVDGTGTHLGGFIVPGLRLMVDSLLAGTSGLADPWSWSESVEPTGFPGNTREAIEQGCLMALAELIEGASRRLARFAGERPRLVLTGGAAPVLASWLAGQQTDLVPDLVLQGLARFA